MTLLRKTKQCVG